MTRRRNITELRKAKKQLWLERTMLWSGLDEPTVLSLLNTSRTQSLRHNTLKSNSRLPYAKIVWAPDGYGLSQDELQEIKLSNEVENGTVYIQNAASWLPVYALNPQPHEKILDVCAAPGGKASHIQALAQNQALLSCNDNSKPRLMKLQANMERLGANASYTLSDATRLYKHYEPETFDKILLDAPCSGEGLMTLSDDKLFDSWSVAHIRRLSDLQKQILLESWRLLKPGGSLVYSTCTMAPEENEAVINYLLRKDSSARLMAVDFPLDNKVPALRSWNNKTFENDLSSCLRLLPSELTEAFFVAKIFKMNV